MLQLLNLYISNNFSNVPKSQYQNIGKAFIFRRKIDRVISLYYFNSQRSQSFLELNLELLVVNFPQ